LLEQKQFEKKKNQKFNFFTRFGFGIQN